MAEYKAPVLESVSALAVGLRLSWANLETYQDGIAIQRAPYGGSYETIDQVGGTVETYDDTTAAYNTRYSYRVSPNGTDGGGVPYGSSNVLSAWTIPGVITGLTATKDDDATSVTLAWTNSNTYSHVRVYYRLNDTGAWTYNDIAFDTTCQVTGLTEAALYGFKVAPYSSTSTLVGTESSVATATVDILPPDGLTLEATANDEITLTWNDNSAVETGFEVYQDGVLVHTTAADVETWAATGLTPGNEYAFKVRAKTASAYSSFSAEETLTAGVPPGDPTGFTATKIDHDGIALAWTCADATDTGIEIYRSLDDITYELIHTTAAHATSYDNTGLTADTLYYYKVRAVNLSGASAYTASDDATTDPYIVAPTNVTATPVSDTQIRVAWTNQSETVDYHEVWRRITGGAYGTGPIGTAGTASYLDGTCLPETEYFYKVRDNYEGDTGAYSGETGATSNSPGTEPTRRSETYFGLGNLLCLQVDTMQGVRFIDSQYISKPTDFSEQDPQAHNRIKTVSLVVLEYEDKSANTPVDISISIDDGVTWTTISRVLGTGDNTQKSAEFRFAPISSKWFKFRVRSNDDDSDFSWTGVYVYYDIGGPSFEVA